MSGALTQITKYPVKGLMGEKLCSAELVKDQGIIGDRQYALTLNETVDGSQWVSSRKYLINSINDGLLTIKPDWANLDSIKDQLPELVSRALSITTIPRLVERSYAKNTAGFWDYTDSQLSFMNRQTLQVVSKALGEDLDIDRFRGNLIIDDLPPWEEFGLAGWRYALGEAEVEFTRPVLRCPATGVNPESGVRDVEVAKLLGEKFGHGYFGIYACVVKSGRIARGDQLTRLGPASMPLEKAMVVGAGRYALWPKLALLRGVLAQPAQSVQAGNSKHTVLELEPSGPWPLVDTLVDRSVDPLTDQKRSGYLKLHLGSQRMVRAEIIKNNVESCDSLLTVVVQKKDVAKWGDPFSGHSLVMSGPYIG